VICYTAHYCHHCGHPLAGHRARGVTPRPSCAACPRGYCTAPDSDGLIPVPVLDLEVLAMNPVYHGATRTARITYGAVIVAIWLLMATWVVLAR
jgi:hypothetical protein